MQVLLPGMLGGRVLRVTRSYAFEPPRDILETVCRSLNMDVAPGGKP